MRAGVLQNCTNSLLTVIIFVALLPVLVWNKIYHEYVYATTSSSGTMRQLLLSRRQRKTSWGISAVVCVMVVYFLVWPQWLISRLDKDIGLGVRPRPFHKHVPETPGTTSVDHVEAATMLKNCLKLHSQLYWIGQQHSDNNEWTIFVGALSKDVKNIYSSFESMCSFKPALIGHHDETATMLKHTSRSVVDAVVSPQTHTLYSNSSDWVVFSTTAKAVNVVVLRLYRQIEFTYMFLHNNVDVVTKMLNLVTALPQEEILRRGGNANLVIIPHFTSQLCNVVLLSSTSPRPSGQSARPASSTLSITSDVSLQVSGMQFRNELNVGDNTLSNTGDRRNSNTGDGIPLPVHITQRLYSSAFIPCSDEAVVIANAKQQRVDEERFSELATQIVVLAKQGLDALGIRFWINSGTLLGWLRECSFLGHSKDVDIGVFASDFDAGGVLVGEMVGVLQSLGLRLTHRFGMLSDSFELSFQTDAGLKLDVFFFYANVDTIGMWNGGTQARTGRKFKYTFPEFSLCWGRIAELFVRVPCNTVEFVKANYGDEWKTPITKWDWKLSPPNVEEHGVWPMSSWKNVIQCVVCVFKVNLSTPW
eukprot:m.11008 g.11008  ORF g.11008 m.11008 type:complete len:589 (-) comp8595_c0_seq1:89-1855(-)